MDEQVDSPSCLTQIGASFMIILDTGASASRTADVDCEESGTISRTHFLWSLMHAKHRLEYPFGVA